MPNKIEEQLKFAFVKGGMADDGKSVDPVSGNDIPPGSMAEEVRDDVDVKLSEGEYVIPADVVQFYGVDRFEKMIGKAKEGLAEMEANGRIGGQPVEEKDDLPFKDEELMATEEQAVGMAQGGMVQAPMTTGIENRMYVNAQGQKRPIMFYNGVPVTPIPEGFFPETIENKKALDVAENTQTAQLAPTTTSSDDDTPPPEMVPMEEWTVEDFEKFASQKDQLGIMSSGAAALGGPAGLLMGGIMTKGYEHTKNRAAEEILARLENPEISQEEKDRLVNVYQDFEKEDKKEGLLGGVLEGGILGNLIDPIFGGSKMQPKATAPATTAKPPTLFSPPKSNEEQNTHLTTVSSTPKSTPQNDIAQQVQQTQREQATISSGTGSDPTTHGFEDEDPRSRGFSGGGLIKKRRKKK